MQITIDTNKDSREDIRKVIALLSAMADKNYSRVRKSSSNIFDDPTLEISSDPGQQSSSSDSSETPNNAFFNMFGGSGSSSGSEKDDDEDKDDSSTEEEKADEGIEIIPY